VAAAEVVGEAGGIVAGGRSIRSPEPTFELAVQGLVVPGQQLTKGGARPGDARVLYKPLGAPASPSHRATTMWSPPP
jgi:selenide,water dikinase